MAYVPARTFKYKLQYILFICLFLTLYLCFEYSPLPSSGIEMENNPVKRQLSGVPCSVTTLACDGVTVCTTAAAR